jgi:hypothetical protein
MLLGYRWFGVGGGAKWLLYVLITLFYMHVHRQDNVCRVGPFLSGLPPLYEGAQAQDQ